MAKKVVVTDEGLKKLQEELNELKTVRRKEITEKIKVARGFGDLSENSEYDDAKNEQALVENRIAELEEQIKDATVISDDDISTEIVNIGTKVKVYDKEYDEECEYVIVGSTESDPINGLISDESPIGKALLGAKVGETVPVEAPESVIELVILSIAR